MNRLLQNDTDVLEGRLLAAHQQGDGAELVRLYTQAADMFEGNNQIETACYFLTNAYIFALESGDERALALYKRLVIHGREE